jgi:hypothetical protein
LLQSRPYESSVKAYQQLFHTLTEVSRQRRGVANTSSSQTHSAVQRPIPLSASRQLKSEN